MNPTFTYLDVVDIKRKDYLDIDNATVLIFFKAVVYDELYFSKIKDKDLQKILLDEFNEDMEDRRKIGSKRITKLKLIECLPEDPEMSFVSVYNGNHTIVSKDDIYNVTSNPDSNSDLFYANKRSSLENSEFQETLDMWTEKSFS